MRPLKVAILLDKFLPSRGGERYFSFLAGALAKRGHEVHIFATKVEETGALPYRVHIVPVARFPRSLRILTFWRNSARAISADDFDIVHGVAQSSAVNVLNPHGGVEQAYLRREFASISNPYYHAYKLLKRYLSLRHYLEVGLQRHLYRAGHVERVIAISTMIKRDIMAYYGYPEDRIRVVFNSVDLDRFHPRIRDLHRERKRSELGIDGSTILLLFAGNNFRLKGMETLIRAMAKLAEDFPEKKFHLLVAGRGRAGRFRGLAERLGVGERVSFLGPVTGMEAYYGAADIYVHPTFYDSCSLTVLEALASGLPVVTTRFNGASDAIVSDEGGMVVKDPGDAGELAGAIGAFVSEERRERARGVARAWMEEYTPERNVEETVRVYYEVVEEKDEVVGGKGG